MFKKIFNWTLFMSILFLTVEILLRRWIWHQVPTPVSAWLVYSILTMNSFFLYYFFIQLFGQREGWQEN